MSRKTGWISMVGLLGAGIFGCGGPSQNVQRVATDSTTDLSGKWNDTDARLTSEALIKDCFSAPWLEKFTQKKGKQPTVRVRGIVNKTDEHIDAQVFVKNIERAMVNSGKVDVVSQEGNEMSSVSAEQKFGTSGEVSDESAPSVGNRTGADYVLVGRMASILDQIEGKAAKFYKITFELIDSTTDKKVWMGDHEIKKLIQQKSASW
jgi:uncharacterized protein (TIGR02722 family)